MPVKLRGHHLLCMLTYQSRGYTPAFVDNYDRVIALLNAGESIEIVDSPDEICEPMIATKSHHCHEQRILERDRLSLLEIGEVLGRELAEGDELLVDTKLLEIMRDAFAAGQIRSACHSCEWNGLCTRIATKSFRGVLLHVIGQESS